MPFSRRLKLFSKQRAPKALDLKLSDTLTFTVSRFTISEIDSIPPENYKIAVTFDKPDLCDITITDSDNDGAGTLSALESAVENIFENLEQSDLIERTMVISGLDNSYVIRGATINAGKVTIEATSEVATSPGTQGENDCNCNCTCNDSVPKRFTITIT